MLEVTLLCQKTMPEFCPGDAEHRNQKDDSNVMIAMAVSVLCAKPVCSPEHR